MNAISVTGPSAIVYARPINQLLCYLIEKSDVEMHSGGVTEDIYLRV